MIEIFLIVVHFSLLFWYVGSTLSAAEAIGFFSATFTSIGWYMSLVFAPNHKSEEIIDAKKKYSWVSQITSTRNIKPSYLIFFLLGGLNFQVEHHLFPTMPRSAYFKANVLVKEFCCTYDITYEESSWFQSMRDIHISLKSAQ
jgi:fatty acid desaturase